MKRFVLITSMLVLCCGIFAQNTEISNEKLLKARQEFNKKYHAQVPQKCNFPVQPAPKDAPEQTKSKDATGLELPADRWFPGEWEEIQAVLVTAYYQYFPQEYVGNPSYSADPLFPGLADLYQYSDSEERYIRMGYGPYVAVLDTNIAGGDVFFYVMDAIQQGNAEAWVRIEQASDSDIVKRKLARMDLRSDNVKFIVGQGNSVWLRDCGPICFYYGAQDSLAMVDFMYFSERGLDDKLPVLINQQKGFPNFQTTVKWEGGNCLVDGAGMVVTSDVVYQSNEDSAGTYTWDGSDTSTITLTHRDALSEQQVYDSLHYIIGPRATYILPALKYDGGTGHIDLYADMRDENEFVFSKFPEAYSNWVDYKTTAQNIDSLCSYHSVFDNNYKHSWIPFPCTDDGGNFASQDDYLDYTRTYSNHTFVNNVLIQPVFSTVVNGVPSATWDAERLEEVKAAYPGYTVYPINVKEFDGSGGAIHCITKQIPAENPVRILHPSITGNTEDTYTEADAPIEAIITNRSGIESASCFYRVDGGAWNQITLDSYADDSFSAMMPTSTMTVTGDYATIEYYISATSNNGKTMTKPITAGQGGYYTFYLGHNPSVSINNAQESDFGQFYPNPATDNANIAISLNGDENFDVNVYNMAGQLVHRSQLNATGSIVFTINTSSLAKGMYNVIFYGKNGQQVVRKLIVQ